MPGAATLPQAVLIPRKTVYLIYEEDASNAPPAQTPTKRISNGYLTDETAERRQSNASNG
jgi:hypothetical protein